MKIRPYVEKLEQSPEFKEFKSQNPEAFVVAGFFVLDLEFNSNVHQIDFYIPNQKKMAAFTLDGQVKLQILDLMNDKVPGKLDLDTNIDLDALKGILLDEMHNRGMSEDIRKIIAVLQNIDGKKIWNINCVLSGMEVLKSHVDAESKTVLKIEKVSIMDMVKKIPTKQLQPPKTKESIKDQIKKLNILEEEIEKEKSELKKKVETKTKKLGKIKNI